MRVGDVYRFKGDPNEDSIKVIGIKGERFEYIYSTKYYRDMSYSMSISQFEKLGDWKLDETSRIKNIMAMYEAEM